MQTTYRPGQWYLIVIPGALVALPPDVPGDVIAQLWERLPMAKTLATVVDVLTTQAGGSFTELPPFAAAVAEGSDVRIALRGGVAARVSTTGDEAKELSGAEVTTWSERFVAGASRVEITVEQTETASGLPVQGGIVRAAAVIADLEPSDAEPLTAAPGPVPVVESEAAGVSAAVLAGAKAPQLATFGAAAGAAAGSLPGASSSEAETPEAEAPEAEAPEVEAPAAADGGDAPAAEGADATETATESIPAITADEPPADEPAADEPAADEPPADEPAVVEPVPAPDAADADDATPEPAEAKADDSALLPSEVTLAPSDEDFDQLWGETVHTASSPAAAAPLVAPAAAPAALGGEGDHDGATISAAELRALRRQGQPAESEAPTQVIPVAAAGAGRIQVSTGQVVALDRTVIIGRRPRSTRASGANMPHLVAVDSPQQDISRSHLEIRPEGDTVVVIDLHTTNGSTLLRPGADPVRLHPGEQTLVLSGDVVDLGDGVTVAFEDLP
ncbi:FHA domain-containing protein [Microbacterium sp. SD291]|uniref:FHA domain-containing protein n=1 Tax=Microbacterium sp. SD291 TaxID=2782007 RepID=UPI001A96D773|nr:FHA domain-containing protein [Microbacterium sp. SD291]MBO0981410.1 FHA domain-containing protein [Microbacterium sp. SD291]